MTILQTFIVIFFKGNVVPFYTSLRSKARLKGRSHRGNRRFPLKKLFQFRFGNIFYATLFVHLGIPNHELFFARLDKS